MFDERQLLRRVLDGTATAEDMTAIINRALPRLAIALVDLTFRPILRRRLLATLTARQQQLDGEVQQ